MTVFAEAAEEIRQERQRGGPRVFTAPKPMTIIPAREDVDPITDDASLIDDVLPDEGFGCMFGAPGSYKTFVKLSMAMAVAGGAEEWHGREVTHGAVLYIGMEGGRLFRNRIAAYARTFGTPRHFYRSPTTINLRSSDEDAKRIVREAQRLAEDGPPVRMVVIDTLSRAMAGGNENAPDDMGAFVSQCEYIRKELGCFLQVVHHSGKDEARGARGSTVLLGAIDTNIHVEKPDHNGVGTITIEKQRDGIDGLRFGFKPRIIELGFTPRGKAVTSVVIDPEDAPGGTKSRKMGPNQKILLEALRQYVDDHGEPCPSGTGWPEFGARQIVPIEGFMTFFAAKLSNDSADDRRRTAIRTFQAMHSRGIIGSNEGKTWIV